MGEHLSSLGTEREPSSVPPVADKKRRYGGRGYGDEKKVAMSPTDALMELMLLPMTAARPARNGEYTVPPPPPLAWCRLSRTLNSQRAFSLLL